MSSFTALLRDYRDALTAERDAWAACDAGGPTPDRDTGLRVIGAASLLDGWAYRQRDRRAAMRLVRRARDRARTQVYGAPKREARKIAA